MTHAERPARSASTLCKTQSATRASHPVADLAGFLLGPWKLTRLGWDGVPGRSLRLHGSARFSRCAAGLRFDERGAMEWGSYQGDVARRYLFRFQTPAVADVCFEDGAPFHRLSLQNGAAHVWHDCPPDRYEGRYRVLGPDCWSLTWRVTGPHKRQRITSQFIRITDPG